MKKAIVLSAGPLSLGIVRSLGIKGIKSIVIYENKYDVAQFSKYCIEKIKINNYLNKKEIFDILIKNKDKWLNSLIIPGSDETLICVSYYKKELEKYYKLNVSDYNIVKQLINKELMYKIATKAKIPIPKTIFPKSIEDVKKEYKNKKINFPCILKPRERHLFYKIFKTKLFIIKNYNELILKYKLCEKNKLKMMITELIPGNDENLVSFVCYVKDGKITNEFQFHKIRQTPAFFGVARVCVSSNEEKLKIFVKNFLKEINFSGNCAFEFKYDERDKKYKFIEVNGRIILNVALSTKCGINYPYILYEDVINNNFIEINDFEKGIYWINLYADLKESLFNQRPTLKEFFKPYFSKNVFAYESFSDPLPMILHWKNNLFNIFANLFSYISLPFKAKKNKNKEGFKSLKSKSSK
ncbi:MAG: hypothetical protein QXE31_06320 [Candidatus Woesearchaeota archaeon]